MILYVVADISSTTIDEHHIAVKAELQNILLCVNMLIVYL